MDCDLKRNPLQIVGDTQMSKKTQLSLAALMFSGSSGQAQLVLPELSKKIDKGNHEGTTETYNTMFHVCISVFVCVEKDNFDCTWTISYVWTTYSIVFGAVLLIVSAFLGTRLPEAPCSWPFCTVLKGVK